MVWYNDFLTEKDKVWSSGMPTHYFSLFHQYIVPIYLAHRHAISLFLGCWNVQMYWWWSSWATNYDLPTPILPIKTPSASRSGTPPGKVMRPPLLCSRPYTLQKNYELLHSRLQHYSCHEHYGFRVYNGDQNQIYYWTIHPSKTYSYNIQVGLSRTWVTKIWYSYRLPRKSLLAQLCWFFSRFR